MRTLAVVSAGLSTPSSTRLLADRLTDATVSALGERGVAVRPEVIELRDHARDLADHLVTGFPNTALRPVLDTVAGADGLIAVSPIFSASYSGLFKTFVDVLDRPDDGKALAGTPVLLGATAGTARHQLALDHAMRPLFAYLHATVVPTGVFAASQDWGAASELTGRITRAAGELADLVAARPARGVADPFADPTPFEVLLRGAS